MKHILYIYSEITIKGGADKVLTEKANYLATHGYRITILTESQMGRPMSFQCLILTANTLMDYSDDYGSTTR